MRKLSAILVLGALLQACAISAWCAPPDAPPHRNIVFLVPAEKQEVPALSFYEDGAWSFHLVVAVWPDGTVVWSDKHDKAGTTVGLGHQATYLKSRIPRERVDGALAILRDAGIQTINDCTRVPGRPGVSYQRFTLSGSGIDVALRTNLDYVEKYPDQLMGPEGETILVKPEEKQAVLDAFPEDYKQFRDTWQLARTVSLSLIPEEGGEPLTNQRLEVLVNKPPEADTPAATATPAEKPTE